MMFWKDRLKVIWSSMKYRESWTLRPRQSFGLIKYLLHSRPTWRGGIAELNAYSPPVGGESYRRYLQGLKRIYRGDVVPLVAHVSVTDRCFYHCGRCSNVNRCDNDPRLEMLLELFKQLRAAGTSRACITGGEPMLRADLVRIVEACGSDLSPLLFTSGHGLDENLAKQLHQAGLTAAFISLDHYLASKHDGIRGMAGAFDKAVEAVRACLHSGIYTAVQAVVESAMLKNGDLNEYLAFCQKLGVDEVMLLEPVQVGNRPACDRLDNCDRKRLAEIHLNSTRNNSLPKVSSMSWLESADCLGCQAGFTFIYISSKGEVFPCDFTPISFGNVYELGLTIIQNRLGRLLRRPSQRCLAPRLEKYYRDKGLYFMSWEQAQEVLHDYEPGPMPKLFRYLYHGK
jgi:MoaA/NifB/PqqE/SkfB family radical SAM enzyme